MKFRPSEGRSGRGHGECHFTSSQTTTTCIPESEWFWGTCHFHAIVPKTLEWVTIIMSQFGPLTTTSLGSRIGMSNRYLDSLCYTRARCLDYRWVSDAKDTGREWLPGDLYQPKQTSLLSLGQYMTLRGYSAMAEQPFCFSLKYATGQSEDDEL